MSIKKSNTINLFDKIRGESLTFGKMLESIRKADCISQVALAKKMKVSKAYLCDIEKGRRQVTLERAMKFAKTLGYSEAQFATKVLEDQIRSAGLRMKVILEAA